VGADDDASLLLLPLNSVGIVPTADLIVSKWFVIAEDSDEGLRFMGTGAALSGAGDEGDGDGDGTGDGTGAGACEI